MLNKTLVALALLSIVSCSSSNSTQEIRFLDELSSIPEFNNELSPNTQSKLGSSLGDYEEVETFVAKIMDSKSSQDCMFEEEEKKESSTKSASTKSITGKDCSVSYDWKLERQFSIDSSTNQNVEDINSVSTLKVEKQNAFNTDIATVITTTNSQLKTLSDIIPAEFQIDLDSAKTGFYKSSIKDGKVKIFQDKEIYSIHGPSALIKTGLVMEIVNENHLDQTIKISIQPTGSKEGISVIVGASVVGGKFHLVGAKVNGKSVSSEELAKIQAGLPDTNPKLPNRVQSGNPKVDLILTLLN